MTTLRVLLHVAAQRDYELHSLDLSTAFLQGSLHEEIWLRGPPGFTGSFPPGTQWSLRRPTYGLRQAPQPLGAVSTMAGPEERGGRGAGSSGEAQAQGQPRDSAMAPMQPSLGPPRDEPRVFGLDKFNCDNFAEWSFKMENIFDHYDLLEVMEGTEKRPENDPVKSPWVRKSAQGYLSLGQALGSSQIRHIKPFQREPKKGPKAWAVLKGVYAPATAAVAVVLERQMAALRIEEDEAVEEGVQKFFDLLTRLEGADLNYSELQKKTKLLALLPESWSSLIINLNRDLPRLLLEDVKRAILQEDFRCRELASADGAGAARIGRGYAVTSALGQRAKVNGMGKAMFKGADGKMVGLKNVLWVPNLAANLISVRQLQKAGMDTSSKGAKTYTARLGEQILWDLHNDRDVYKKMWQIPVVPMPKERQVAARTSTKGEAVGSGDGANGRTKEIESKKCNLGGTSKRGEHEESGAAAKEQHMGEENPRAVAEEEYGENMWGTIASAAFSNPTSATGECDWLTLHRQMGHVALPILQQLVKITMVSGIRVKGEPDEILGCPTCMQAKFTRYSFSSSEATAKAPLDEVVMEVVGPLKLGASGADYFLTIVDPDAVRIARVAKNRALTHVGADKWVPYVERVGRKPKVDMLRVFGCMCMALVPKHLRHNKLGAKAIWAVHLGMAQNSKGWLLWDPFTKKFLVRRNCKFMENLMYKDWKADNEAKISMRFGEVKSSGLEHVELPLELSSGSTTTRQSSLVNGGEEAKDAEEEEEEVQQVSERAPTLPSRTTSAPRIRVTPQQRQGIMSLQLRKKEGAKEWKKAMESELKSIEENGTWELVELPEGCKAITSKWLFKIKSDADGKIECYKSRLVAKGYQQKEKVDNKELFTPVVKSTTLRTLLAGATIKG
ncbi:unnamed protein product [Closterium sp. NIES-53]